MGLDQPFQGSASCPSSLAFLKCPSGLQNTVAFYILLEQKSPGQNPAQQVIGYAYPVSEGKKKNKAIVFQMVEPLKVNSPFP